MCSKDLPLCELPQKCSRMLRTSSPTQRSCLQNRVRFDLLSGHVLQNPQHSPPSTGARCTTPLNAPYSRWPIPLGALRAPLKKCHTPPPRAPALRKKAEYEPAQTIRGYGSCLTGGPHSPNINAAPPSSTIRHGQGSLSSMMQKKKSRYQQATR